jgi:hypothetical protein
VERAWQDLEQLTAAGLTADERGAAIALLQRVEANLSAR